MTAVYVNVPMFIYNRSMLLDGQTPRLNTNKKAETLGVSSVVLPTPLSPFTLHCVYFSFFFDSLCVRGVSGCRCLVCVGVCGCAWACVRACVWTMRIDGCNPEQIKRALILATIT